MVFTSHIRPFLVKSEDLTWSCITLKHSTGAHVTSGLRSTHVTYTFDEIRSVVSTRAKTNDTPFICLYAIQLCLTPRLNASSHEQPPSPTQQLLYFTPFHIISSLSKCCFLYGFRFQPQLSLCLPNLRNTPHTQLHSFQSHKLEYFPSLLASKPSKSPTAALFV